VNDPISFPDMVIGSEVIANQFSIYFFISDFVVFDAACDFDLLCFHFLSFWGEMTRLPPLPFSEENPLKN